MTDFLHVSGHEVFPLASTLLGHLLDWDIVEIMTSTSCVHACVCACVCVSGETSLYLGRGIMAGNVEVF